MQNLLLVLRYNGTPFHGWQIQPNGNTVQQELCNAFKKISGNDENIIGCSRTDAGVHAVSQVANFKCETDKTTDEIKDYLNHYLPADILVTSIEEVHDRFHSRLNAVSKTYEYAIATKKPDVFIRKYVFATDRTPDVGKMRSAAKRFLGSHDFKGFSSLGKTKKSTVRTINSLEIEEDCDIIVVRVNGSGFLYNMVRIIAGTLLEIGCGNLDEDIIDKVFEEKIREYAGPTLPACGLKLVEVFY